MQNYRIVIPSRKRLDVIRKTISMLPTATVVVHELEVNDYKNLLPNTEVIGHNKSGIVEIRQWILDNFKEETIVMCDDDLRFVRALVGERQRIYRDPDIIRKIIENSIQISRDLNIKLFYFNRDPRPLYFNSSDPMGFCGGFAAGLFGINGRELRFDTNLHTREDVDLTLQTLMKHRIVYSERRFYFDFGQVWQGTGGNQGVRTNENEERDKEYIYSKWSKMYINLDSSKKKFNTGAVNRVQRKSPLSSIK